MSEDPDVVVQEDPYGQLRPVLRGVEPDDDKAWVYGDDVSLLPVESDRNLWDLFILGVPVVTFDADAFPTTADLGQYIEGVAVNMTSESGPEDEDGDDPRQLGSGAFQ